MPAEVPHLVEAVEAERGVLGSILLDAGRVLAICDREGVADTSFTVSPHPDIFRAALAVRAAGASVDLLTLTARLRASGRLEGIGGAAFLEGLIDQTPTAAHAEFYIGMLRAADDRRRLAAALDRARGALEKPENGPAIVALDLAGELAAFRPVDVARSDDGAAVLAAPHETPPMIAAGLFGPGDILQLNAPSKGRKSFCLLQCALCAVAGRPFLGIEIAAASPAVFVNMELRPVFFRERLRHLAAALGIAALPTPLRIIHGRGRTPADVLNDVRHAAEQITAAAVFLDPIYPFSPTGDENNSRDAKELAATLAALAEATGAALLYSHHTPKGAPADRAAVDRGAGSSILARAFDVSMSLLPHATEPDAYVVEVVLRNFAPRAPFAVRWAGHCFTLAPDLAPDPETARTRQSKAAASRQESECATVQRALGLLADGPLTLGAFKSKLRTRLHLGDHRAREIQALVAEQPGIAVRRAKGFQGAYYIGRCDALERIVEE